MITKKVMTVNKYIDVQNSVPSAKAFATKIMATMVYTHPKHIEIKRTACLSQQKTLNQKLLLKMTRKNVSTKLEIPVSLKVVIDHVIEKVDLIIILRNVKEQMLVKLNSIHMSGIQQ